MLKIVLALILGAASTAALAGDSGEMHQDNDRAVVSASVGKSANAGAAYGYSAAPTHKRPAQSR
jgi:hypothetical protein